MTGVKGEELVVSADNKIGKLSEIAVLLKDNGINVRAISAWGCEDKATFRLITSDNNNAKNILNSVGIVESKGVLIVEMPDEAGQLEALTSKLKEADININYIYGTTSQLGKPAIIVFSTSDDDKALESISN